MISGAIISTATGTALSGATIDVATEGVFRRPKAEANTFTIGAPVYYDATAKPATSVSSGNSKIGVAIEAGESGAADMVVRLAGF